MRPATVELNELLAPTKAPPVRRSNCLSRIAPQHFSKITTTSIRDGSSREFFGESRKCRPLIKRASSSKYYVRGAALYHRRFRITPCAEV
jgi:hypothetical protein